MSHSQRKWPIHFVKYLHNWEEIFDIEDEENNQKLICVKCKDCDITAKQDIGSLSYFVVDGYAENAILTCDQIQIKKIII